MQSNPNQESIYYCIGEPQEVNKEFFWKHPHAGLSSVEELFPQEIKLFKTKKDADQYMLRQKTPILTEPGQGVCNIIFKVQCEKKFDEKDFEPTAQKTVKIKHFIDVIPPHQVVEAKEIITLEAELKVYYPPTHPSQSPGYWPVHIKKAQGGLFEESDRHLIITRAGINNLLDHLEQNVKDKLKEKFQQCFDEFDKLNALKETFPERYQTGLMLETQTYLLMKSILDKEIPKDKVPTKAQIQKVNDQLTHIHKGLSLSTTMLQNPTTDTVQNLKNFAEKEAPGKTESWKVWLGVLLAVAAAGLFATAMLGTMGAAAIIPLGIAIAAILVPSTLGSVVSFFAASHLLGSGQQHGLAQTMSEAVKGTRKPL